MTSELSAPSPLVSYAPDATVDPSPVGAQLTTIQLPISGVSEVNPSQKSHTCGSLPFPDVSTPVEASWTFKLPVVPFPFPFAPLPLAWLAAPSAGPTDRSSERPSNAAPATAAGMANRRVEGRRFLGSFELGMQGGSPVDAGMAMTR